MSSRKQKLEASLEGLFSGPKARPPAKADAPAARRKPKSSAKKAEEEKPTPLQDVPAPVPVSVPAESEKPVIIAQETPPAPIIPEKIATRPETPAPPGGVEEPLAVTAKSPVSDVAVRPAREVVSVAEEARPGIELTAIDEGLQIVTFRLNKSFYGVDIAAVQTIIKPQAVCQVPFTAPYIEGLTNLRGQIVPIIDLRKRMSLPMAEVDKDTRIIVVSIFNEWAGIRVDEVTGVTTLPSNAIEPAVKMVSSSEGSLLAAIGRKDKDLILILDIPAVFAVNERTFLRAKKSALDNYD